MNNLKLQKNTNQNSSGSKVFGRDIKPSRGQDKKGVTGVTLDTIKRIGKRITHIPEDFNVHPTIKEFLK